MVEQGCLNGIDEVYGFHNIPNFEEGDIRVVHGPIFAGSITMEIEVIGQGGHGSAPHRCVKDPITAACNMLNAFHSIKARNIDSRDNVVFTICHIRSGNTHNVFPDSAFLQGSCRYYRKEVREIVVSKIHKIAEEMSKACGCTAKVKINEMSPPIVNHAE